MRRMTEQQEEREFAEFLANMLAVLICIVAGLLFAIMFVHGIDKEAEQHVNKPYYESRGPNDTGSIARHD